MMTPFPDDDRRSAHLHPLEVMAAEQRILTRADALMTWMIKYDWGENADTLGGYFAHTTQKNPGGSPLTFHTHQRGKTETWVLETLDRDANMLFLELLRSAWELRCWKARYGLIVTPHPQGEAYKPGDDPGASSVPS